MNFAERHRIAKALRLDADILALMMRRDPHCYAKRAEFELEIQELKTLASKIERADEGCIVCNMNAGGGVALCQNHKNKWHLAPMHYSEPHSVDTPYDTKTPPDESGVSDTFPPTETHKAITLEQIEGNGDFANATVSIGDHVTISNPRVSTPQGVKHAWPITLDMPAGKYTLNIFGNGDTSIEKIK